MATTRLTIPSFVGGVSRQPASIRRISQVEEADNCFLTIPRGSEKRPGSVFVKGEASDGSLMDDYPQLDKHIHWVDRGGGEQYVMVFTPDAPDEDVIQVFTTDGVKQTISPPISPDLADYIRYQVTDPSQDIRVVSVADATFILNRKKATKLTGDALTYKNDGDELPVRSTDNEHNVESFESEEIPIPPDPSDLTVDNGETATVGAGRVWYTRTDTPGYPAGFYKAISADHPPWYERIRTEPEDSEVDPLTMPLRLNNNGDGTFTLEVVRWNARLAGDSHTNKGPSFMGRPLSDITFFRNRLFLASGETLFGTQSGDLFNVWRSSREILGDADPIDVTTSSQKITNIEFVVPFVKHLVLMTQGERQFELVGDEILGPNTAALIPTTSYASSNKVRPVVLGTNMYFVAEQQQSSQLYEYFYNEGAASNIAVDVTDHVQGYVPADITTIASAENHNLLFLLSKAASNCLYVYQTFWAGEEKYQSSWSRWVFDEDNEILSCHVFTNVLYMLIRRDGRLWLEYIRLGELQNESDAYGTLSHPVLLDRRLSLEGEYDPETNETVWKLPFRDPSIDEVVLGPGFNCEFEEDGKIVSSRRASIRLLPENDSSGDFTILKISGNYATNLEGNPAAVFVGRSYSQIIELSEQFQRDQEGKSVDGRLMLRRMIIRHKTASTYEVHVTPTGRETVIHRFVARRLGSTFVLGAPPIDRDGIYQVPILASAQGVKIVLINNSPMPSNFISAEFLASFIPLKQNSVN